MGGGGKFGKRKSSTVTSAAGCWGTRMSRRRIPSSSPNVVAGKRDSISETTFNEKTKMTTDKN